MNTSQEQVEKLKRSMADLVCEIDKLQGQNVSLQAQLDWTNATNQFDQDSKAVAAVESEWTCVICNQVFIDPSSLLCGHTFCSHCLRQWLSNKPDCPSCREPCVGVKDPKKNVAISTMIERTYNALQSSEEWREERAKALKEREEEVKMAATAAPELPTPIRVPFGEGRGPLERFLMELENANGQQLHDFLRHLRNGVGEIA